MKNLFTALLLTMLAWSWGCQKAEPPKVEAPPVPIDIKSGRLITAGGVKYYVPPERGSHTDGPGEFKFECENLRLIVSNGKVQVNGKSFGTVKSGDTVSFLNKGHVFVNGELRPPQP
jgi:hypothetical protein